MRSIFTAAVVFTAGSAFAADNPQNRTRIGERTGIASFYSSRMEGRTTASGKRFHNSALTAAHRELPLGSKVQVTNVANGKSVVVEITDRGPSVKGREISVTRRAARELGFTKQGTTQVKISPVN